ncbi:MAG: AbrB/MazE/SpoVT family DNA-binding domain-containing protein [Candidatus Woesearchaeota archaeon]
MQRKVIQIANSTYLVSLPKAWMEKHGIHKGDSLEIRDEKNSLNIYPVTHKHKETKTTLDISELDRSSILHSIRALYRKGFDEVILNFSKQSVPHFRVSAQVNIINVIHEEVNRLIGYEIVRQTPESCEIKDLSASSIKEFDVVLRRIMLLIKDITSDLLKGVLTHERMLLESIDQKHNTITKFISYCLRLLNKYGYIDAHKTTILYHIIASLDKVVDIIKYVARDCLVSKKELSKTTKALFERTHINCILVYIDLFYSFNQKNIIKFMRNRDVVTKVISANIGKMPCNDVAILTKYMQSLEILLDLIEARLALEHV